MSWPDIFIPFFAVLCLIYRRRTSFYASLAVAAIVWNASTALGVNMTASKVLIGVFLITFGISSFWSCRESVPLSGIFYLVLFYSLFCSLIGVVFVDPGAEITELQHSLFQKFPVRGFVATVYWIMNVSFFALGFFCFESRKHLTKCLNTYLATSYVVSILAAVQVGAYYLFPPLERLLAFFTSEGSTVATAATTISGFNIYRPFLFSAEPRYLGLAMALASAIVIVSRTVILPGMNKSLISSGKLLLYVAIMLASASTSALAGFAGGLVVLWVCIRRHADGFSLPYRLRRWQLTGLMALSVIGFTGLEYKTGYMSQRFGHYSSAMGITGNEQYGAGDKSNAAGTAYFRVLADNPLKAILGFGIGNIGFVAYDYLDPSSADYRDGTVLSSRFPLIDLLAGIGVLGLTCVVLLWFRWLSYIRDCSFSMNEPSLLFLYYMLVFLFVALLVLDTLSLIWLFLGIALALIRRMQVDDGVLPAL